MRKTRIAAPEPEDRVLLHTARLRLGPTGVIELERLLASGVEWDRLIRKADWLESAALLLHHIETWDLAGMVPAPAYSRLNDLKQEQRVRFFFFLRPELLRVLEGMSSAGVEVIPLKGAYLLNTVYPDVSLRPIGDLDVLVREDDLSPAAAVLAELSYRSRSGERLVVKRGRDTHHHLPRVLSPDGSVELELHRHVVRGGTPLHFPIERFWERSINGVVGDQQARLLAPRDLVTHLCLAFFMDRRRRARGHGSLRQLVDLSESIRYFEREVDWAGMVEEFVGGSLQGPLYTSLRTARELLDAPVPEDFLQAFRPRGFDEVLLGHFLRLKVLREGLWFFHDLVEPKDNHGWNITKAAIHRLIPPDSYLREKFHPAAASTRSRLYLEHFRDAYRTAVGVARSPRSMIREIRTDTWMNELQLQGSGAP